MRLVLERHLKKRGGDSFSNNTGNKTALEVRGSRDLPPRLRAHKRTWHRTRLLQAGLAREVLERFSSNASLPGSDLLAHWWRAEAILTCTGQKAERQDPACLMELERCATS